MTLRELVQKETLKTLDEIEKKVNFTHNSRFFVIKVHGYERYKSISTNLESLDIHIEPNYGNKFNGYIWLRWSMESNRFISYLNYTNEGERYNAPLYESSDFLTPGEILSIKDDKVKKEIKS